MESKYPIIIQARYARELLTSVEKVIRSLDLPLKLEISCEYIKEHKNLNREVLEELGVIFIEKESTN